MILKDMIETLRSPQYERIEIRDREGWEQLTCQATSPALGAYMDIQVLEWFPGCAPNKDSTFVVYLKLNEDPCDDCVYDGLDPFDDTTPYFSCRDGSHCVKKEEETDDEV